LSQIVFIAKPNLVPALGSNTRTITLHGDTPEPTNPPRDGNSINAATHRILA
jgi:hypothetical protein